MTSIVFGIKGFEAMLIDLEGCDVILDEIHSYASETQAIVLKIIEILKSIGSRIHVGTATMPSVLYSKILELLGGTSEVYEP
jgi:CRISPR-associated endonuclease/helicase Cas3